MKPTEGVFTPSETIVIARYLGVDIKTVAAVSYLAAMKQRDPLAKET